MERCDLRAVERPGTTALPIWLLAAALPAVVGGLWLWWDARSGVPGLLVGALPGALLLSTGLSTLLWARDKRIFQFMSLGAASGMTLSFPAALVFGPVAALVLLAGSAAGFVAAGYLSVWQERVPAEVPEPEMTPGIAARAAQDELSMCGIVLTTWPLSVGERATQVGRELDEALVLFEERGWKEYSASYHRTPPPLEKPGRGDLRYDHDGFEHLSFESGYEPWPEEPGRERWLSYENNRTAHAWVLRHPGEPRPWMVCIHGIRMGSPRADIRLFQPDYLYRDLGLNLLFPVLPIHGPRRVGPVSGDRILAGDVMDTLHAGSQAIWDIRRLILWLEKGEGAPAVGVLGHSLGGYVAALLAGLAPGLDCVISGNPAVDPSRLFWNNALSLATRYLKAAGVDEARMHRLTRAVSPLEFAPLVNRERLAIFAGVADRVVPPIEAHSLWKHWGHPRIAWYNGTHRGFLRVPEGRDVLEDTLRAAGMLPPNS
ncbi:MAG TPA: hypothetical protein VFJ72_16000 [Rubrobacteraceae bacterium]|nr:hypothetical protein [Rubrobacteraceae bacterium]